MAVLDPDLLLRAYAIGVFPMADSRDAKDVFWVEPRRRAIIPVERFHLSRSLRRIVRSGIFTVTRDTAFAETVARCAKREETWINDSIQESFAELHRLGHAHSIECWQEGELAGGLYGVKLGAAFFGESMFSQRPNASKVALAWLVARLKVGGYRLLDCQFMTEHLRSLGAVEITQKAYVSMLSDALSSAGSGAGGGAEFGALERLLGADSSRTVDSAASGCVIAQLLGHMS
jgi:leucyl/phenylalanyl-tRNA---protein transferase